LYFKAATILIVRWPGTFKLCLEVVTFEHEPSVPAVAFDKGSRFCFFPLLISGITHEQLYSSPTIVRYGAVEEVWPV
jgi:hypothetical protein